MALSPTETRALVDRLGSQTAAAKEMGVSRSTIQYWLDPSVQQERMRKRYARNLDASRKRLRDQYWNETGVQHARRLLKNRRVQALHRMAKRNEAV